MKKAVPMALPCPQWAWMHHATQAHTHTRTCIYPLEDVDRHKQEGTRQAATWLSHSCILDGHSPLSCPLLRPLARSLYIFNAKASALAAILCTEMSLDNSLLQRITASRSMSIAQVPHRLPYILGSIIIARICHPLPFTFAHALGF